MAENQRLLIRIDDIGFDDAASLQFVRTLCEVGLRVTCAVVPEWLDERCRDFLCAVAGRYPGRLEVHQHGLTHTNYATSGDPKHEFGPDRCFDDQLNDMIRGRETLESAFGELFFAAFTPPYGFCDQSTLRALAQARFQCVSTFAEDGQNEWLPAISPEVDCCDWDPPLGLSWETVMRKWQDNSSKPFSGFILHPRFMNEHAMAEYSAGFQSILPNWETVHFRDALVAGVADGTLPLEIEKRR